jgi:hypothetical protein
MAEEREPFPTEDPRQATTSDQNTEENPEAVNPRDGEPADRGPSPDALDTSKEEEGDAGQATGNPRAAG